MLEAITDKLNQCRFRELEEQFMNEDLDKEILFLAKDKSEDQIMQRRKFLEKRLDKRKSLYIYPTKVTV